MFLTFYSCFSDVFSSVWISYYVLICVSAHACVCMHVWCVCVCVHVHVLINFIYRWMIWCKHPVLSYILTFLAPHKSPLLLLLFIKMDCSAAKLSLHAKKLCEELGLYPDPTTVICNFESLYYTQFPPFLVTVCSHRVASFICVGAAWESCNTQDWSVSRGKTKQWKLLLAWSKDWHFYHYHRTEWAMAWTFPRIISPCLMVLMTELLDYFNGIYVSGHVRWIENPDDAGPGVQFCRLPAVLLSRV